MLIKRRSLTEEVAAKLQEQISLGHYKVNDKLPIEPELMKAFGVGRSTIREAVKLLTNSGLLRVQQGVGTFIQSETADGEPINQRLKRAAVTDLNEIRQLLEMKIAEKAAVNRTERHIVEMRNHLAARKAAAHDGNLQACVEADINFHMAIAEASGNEILADLYKSAAVHLKNWFLEVHNDTSAFENTYGLHEQLMENIVAGDSKKAWEIAAKIISYSHQ